VTQNQPGGRGYASNAVNANRDVVFVALLDVGTAVVTGVSEGRRWAMSREAWIAVAVVVGVVALLTLYGAVRLARKVLATRRQLGPLTTGGKVAFYGSLLYTIFPIDLLPDPVYLDDMAVLGAALLYLTKLLHARGRLPGMPHARVAPDARSAELRDPRRR